MVVSLWGHCSSSRSWRMQDFICDLQDCFCLALGSPIIKSHWPSRSGFPGYSCPLSNPQARKSDIRFRNPSHTVGEHLVFLSPVCGVIICSVWDLNLSHDCALIPSHCNFFFVFGHGASFFGGLQCPPVNDCSTASCYFGVLAGGDECMSFYSTIKGSS